MFFKSLYFLLFALINPTRANNKNSFNYQLIFPLDSPSPYAHLVGTIPRQLMDLTICYWVRPHRNAGCDVIFSYAIPKAWSHIKSTVCAGGEQGYFQRQAMTEESANSKSTKRGGFDMQLDRVLLGKQSLQKFSWVHSCITWSSLEGRWQFYLNGFKYNEGTGLTVGEFVQPNGVVVLGQDQEAEDGTNDTKDQMRGQISEVNLWDSVLTPEDINKVATCENDVQGNVIGWKSATWEMYDGTRVAPVKLPCVKPRHT